MKKLFLILLFTSVSFAQHPLLTLFSDDGFNPTLYDANVAALYNGDVGLTTSGWADQKSTNNITFTNSPSVYVDSANGHGAVRFNGSDESGYANIAALDRPLTYYVVFKPIAYTTNSTQVVDGYGATNSAGFYLRTIITDRIYGIYGGSATGSPNYFASVPAGRYYLATITFNTDSVITLNINNGTISQKLVAADPNGISLAARGLDRLAGFSNVEFAYIILRRGIDDAATKLLYQTYLSDRFGINLSTGVTMP